MLRGWQLLPIRMSPAEGKPCDRVDRYMTKAAVWVANCPMRVNPADHTTVALPRRRETESLHSGNNVAAFSLVNLRKVPRWFKWLINRTLDLRTNLRRKRRSSCQEMAITWICGTIHSELVAYRRRRSRNRQPTKIGGSPKAFRSASRGPRSHRRAGGTDLALS